MVKRNVWLAIPRKEVTAGAKILSCTWDMKKKSNRQYRARFNTRWYEQIGGVHYDSTSISSPVTNYANVRILLVPSLICGWAAELIYVQGGLPVWEFKERGKCLYGCARRI
jgi:hypothetical protein